MPDRYRVIFRDGNKLNFAIDNLQLMALEEVSARVFANYYAYPEPLQRAAMALGKLKRRVRKELSGAPDKVSSCQRRSPRSPSHRWTAEMGAALAEKYPTEPLEKIAEDIGTTVSSIREPR